MASTDAQSRCAMCNHHSTQMCGGCKSIRYCSKNCQKSDWSIHKLVCKEYEVFMSTRPSSDHHSVIYFPADEDKPRFAWIRYVDGYSRLHPEDISQLGCDAVKVEGDGRHDFGSNKLLDRHIEPHHISLSLPEAEKLCPCCTPNLPANQSLAKVDKELAEFFRAPVLAWGFYCCADRVRNPSDLDLTSIDFRHVVDELRFIYSTCEEEIRSVMHGKDVAAVRINCRGDQQFLGRPPLEHVHEPSSALQTESQLPTPVADKLGLPLIVRKVPAAPFWRDRHLHARMQNPEAPMLSPPRLSADTGSLIVCRTDGKALHPVHITALIDYTSAILVDPKHSGSANVTAKMLTMDRIVQVSKEDFQRWYPTQWNRKSFPNLWVPSPFDIKDDFMRSLKEVDREKE